MHNCHEKLRAKKKKNSDAKMNFAGELQVHFSISFLGIRERKGEVMIINQLKI